MKRPDFEVKYSKFTGIFEGEFIRPQTKEICMMQEILLIPESQNETGSVFAQEAISFYKFTKENTPSIKIDFYADRESIHERSLHSFDIYMPIIFVATNIILPFVINLVTNYVYDRMKGREHEECTVKVTFIVQEGDSRKELHYDGPAKDFEKAFEKIDISKL